MELLQIIWFILIAVLWTGYLVLEGFGIGAGMAMPLVAKTDKERTQVQATYGPVWDGNEVWLLTAGGATFAAFPEWYATMFSGMYLALFLILLCLIVRICALEWRSKISSPVWRARWDNGQVVAAWLVPILFGVAFGNLVQGMKIEVVSPDNPTVGVTVPEGGTAADLDLATNIHNFTGKGALLDNVFLSLLTPYTILGGVALCLLFISQGLLWLGIRTTGEVHSRSMALAKKVTIATTAVVAVFALWGQFVYAGSVLAWIPLVVAALALIGATAQVYLGKEMSAFLLNSVAIAGAVAWIFAAMAPNVMKSSINDAFSLTISQASSTQSTLTLMLVVAVILVPVVLGYTAWSYSRLPRRIDLDDLAESPGLPWDRIRENATFLKG